MTKNYKLLYTPEAIEHIKHIAEWYNEQSNGLGTRFKNNLKTALTDILKKPLSHSCRYDDVRFAIPKKFPYAAHYTIDENNKTIIIHAIFAFKEDPDKWGKEIQ